VMTDRGCAANSGSCPTGQAEFHRLGALRCDPGREVEVDLAARQIALDADFLSVAPKPLVAQNRDILESARERLNDALARIGA
jgi:hypothetical protein